MRDQQMESWLCDSVHAFEHFHGIPALAVPDNTKMVVTRAYRYDLDLNPTYDSFAQHCGFGIVLALRHRKFFSLEELNQAIRELLERLKPICP